MNTREKFPYSLEYLNRVAKPMPNVIVAWPDGFGIPHHYTTLESAMLGVSESHGMGYGGEGKPSQIQLRLGEHVIGTVTNGVLELVPEYEYLRPDKDQDNGEEGDNS